jgi:hypothetical protein
VQGEGRALDGFLEVRVVAPDRVQQEAIEAHDDGEGDDPSEDNVADDMASEDHAHGAY